MMLLEDFSPEQQIEALKKLREKIPPEDKEPLELVEYAALGTERLTQLFSQVKERAKDMESTAYDITAIMVEHYRSNKSDRPMQWSSVYNLLVSAVNLLEGSLAEKVTIYIDPGVKAIGKIFTHRIVFLQILSNLLTNASESILRSGNPKGMIRISGFVEKRAGREYVHILVYDNGEGIEPEILEEIFKRHYSSKKNFGFSGLGLHWCSNAILSLNGSIMAESPGKGQGATMHLVVKREIDIPELA